MPTDGRNWAEAPGSGGDSGGDVTARGSMPQEDGVSAVATATATAASATTAPPATPTASADVQPSGAMVFTWLENVSSQEVAGGDTDGAAGGSSGTTPTDSSARS
jgi:hypothetical protein